MGVRVMSSFFFGGGGERSPGGQRMLSRLVFWSIDEWTNSIDDDWEFQHFK